MSETIHSNGGRNPSTGSVLPSGWRLGGLILTVLIGGVLVYAVRSHSWEQLRRLEQEFATIRTESFYLGVKLRDAIGRLNDTVLRSQLSKADLEIRDTFYEDARRLQDLADATAPHLTTDEQRELVRKFGNALAVYLTNMSALIERPVRAVRRDSATQVYAEIEELARPVLSLCQQLVTAQAAAWDGFMAESQASLASMQTLLRISTWTLLGLVAAVVGLMYRAFVQPLQTRLSQSEALVERKAKLASLGTLAAGVAHEIRNPLAAIKFRLFSLKKVLPGELREQEDLRIIGSEINRLERIVQEFLQFARPAKPVRQEISVAVLLRDVHELLEPQLKRKNIQFTVPPAEALLVEADRQQMVQVLINLVQNAAESIDGAGRITLSARAGTGQWGNDTRPAVLLEVADTGKGIPPEVEACLFDPFFSTKEGGTGLGLPMAARIVEMHGGLLQHHTQLQRGTTFQIVLPRPRSHAR